MKRIAVAVLVGGACLSASALEQLQDDALSNSVGQSGLTIDISPVSITAQHLRFYDSDGFTGYANPSSLDIANLSITTTTDTSFHLDAGSTGTGSAAKTALFLSIGPITNMSVTTGNISTDAGNELFPGINTHNFAQFSATNIDVSAVDLLVVPGGHFYGSGLTLSTLSPVTASAAVALTDTVDGGVISAQLSVTNFMLNNGSVDVMPTGQGIEFGAGSSTLEAVTVGDLRVGASAFSGADMGTVTVRNMNFTGTTVSVSGH